MTKPVRGYQAPGEGRTFGISLATSIALFVGWDLITRFGVLPPLILPSPTAVWQAFMAGVRGELQGGVTIFEHFAWSVTRVFGAFFAACLTAVPIGILMGVSRIARGVFDPPIEFYRPLPPLAYLPLVIIWFGIDEASKVILIYLACFAPLAVAARAGVRSVTVEQINAARSLGASQFQA
ncbi:MAG: ABC transporter permease subunit, partial [Proteobacteria bacterium]|nr:ABC transporter permease subunit [Pseudomonadota bacterium]